jgi:hypothetical protein
MVSVIAECDKAIHYAINLRSGKAVSEESEHQFEEAIRCMSAFESKFHHRYMKLVMLNIVLLIHCWRSRSDANYRTVDERMKVAREKDEMKKYKSRDVCEAPSVALPAHPPPLIDVIPDPAI